MNNVLLLPNPAALSGIHHCTIYARQIVRAAHHPLHSQGSE